MKLRQTIATKQTLSATLRNWLPLLQCPLNELEVKLKEYASINPYVEIESNQEMEFVEDEPESEYDDIREGYDDFDHFQRFDKKNSHTDTIEAMSVHKKSLYERLYEQVSDQLLRLPFYTNMTEEDQMQVVKALMEFTV